MRISLEYIFSIDNVVPVDVLPVFSVDTITMLFIQVHFYRRHTFPCLSLLLSTTILNDICDAPSENQPCSHLVVF